MNFFETESGGTNNLGEEPFEEEQPVDFNPWPLTLIVSLLALWIAHQNYRRNNFVIVPIFFSMASESSDGREDDDQMYAWFQMTFQNFGIPLFDLRVDVLFETGRGIDHGWELAPVIRSRREGQFAKGMMATYALSSRTFHSSDFDVLSTLSVNQATFILQADGYEVQRFRLNGFWSRRKKDWNGFASRVNTAFGKRKGKAENGESNIEPREVLSKFHRVEDALEKFLNSLPKYRPQAEPKCRHEPPLLPSNLA